jgi:Fe-S-cluster containining protein
MSDKIARAGRKLLPLFQEIEPWVEGAKENSSCRQGCAHCCRLFPRVTLAEGVLIADHLERTPIFSRQLGAIKAQLLEQLQVIQSFGRIKLTEQQTRFFHHSKAPCAFLDSKNNCSIYAIRPLVCRTHVVVSDPELCSPARPNTTVQTLDPVVPNTHFNQRLVEETLKDIPFIIGPLQWAILFAFELLHRDRKDFKAWVRKGGAQRYEVANTESLV